MNEINFKAILLRITASIVVISMASSVLKELLTSSDIEPGGLEKYVFMLAEFTLVLLPIVALVFIIAVVILLYRAIFGFNVFYETDLTVIKNAEHLNKEESLFKPISSYNVSGSPEVVNNLIGLALKVHAGFQRYPLFKAYRSKFYNGDIKALGQVLDVLDDFDKGVDLSLEDDELRDQAYDALVKFGDSMQMVLDRQRESLINKALISFDVLRGQAN